MGGRVGSMSTTARPPRRASGLPGKLHLTAPRRSFAPVLAAIVVAVVFQMSAPDTDLTRLIGVLIQGSVIVLALRAAGAGSRVIVAATALVAAFTLAAILALLLPGEPARAAPRVLTLILVVLAPTAIVAGVLRELREDGKVTVQTIICGICLYLLVGLAFASLYGAIEDLSGEHFFRHGVPGTPNDFLYFSLATLTTTGYGDFAAATELGRAISVTEALVGQIYLVTVLAVIVGNVGQSRRGDVSSAKIGDR